MQGGGAASSQGVQRGRAAIFGPGDDGSEDQPRVIVPRKQGRKGIRAAMGWATIHVRNIDIMCFCGRGRQLLVPVGTEDLDRIVQHLMPRAGESPKATPGTFQDLLEKMDENRITWRLSRRRRKASSQVGSVDSPVGHWHVLYTDNDRRECESSVGLGVPQMSLIGDPLTQDEMLAAARLVLVRARREWNRLDCSGSDRFPVR